MGVKRNNTPLDIKKAYKRMSLELHPDKNKAPNAAEEFARLKDAYDVRGAVTHTHASDTHTPA
jgi:DnaJ-class molecular chaperone